MAILRRKGSAGSDSVNIMRGMRNRTGESPVLWVCRLFVEFGKT